MQTETIPAKSTSTTDLPPNDTLTNPVVEAESVTDEQLKAEIKTGATPQTKTMYRILFAISLVHLLNDTMQSVIPAIFPILQDSMNLSFVQIGLIGFALNFTSSLLQPVVGLYTDKRPSPFLLPIGLSFSLFGMLGLALANSYLLVLLSVVLVGVGSSVFHPEGARVAYMAAGPRRGLAQSIFQVGGNSGQALAPIMTALIFVPLGQFGAIWFTIVAALAVVILMFVSRWYKNQLLIAPAPVKKKKTNKINLERKSKVKIAILVLILLVFARSWYGAGITSFYAFYLIDEYGQTIKQAQYFLFAFLAAGVAGTFFGGPLADRFGKRNIILFSILGAAPLALLLPHLSLFFIFPLLLVMGFILLSSFSVTVVYAQELIPGKIGTVSGLIIGLAFGLGAIGSLALGGLADAFGLKNVMILCSLLPILGILTLKLPKDATLRKWQEEADA